jgi:hypothetical protein
MDTVAMKVQKRFLSLLAVDLGALLAAAIVSSLAVSPQDHLVAQSATAALFATSLVVTLVLALKSYARSWFRGRARAESIKTLAWRYMTCAPPYASALGQSDADAHFANDLRRILEEGRDVPLGPAAEVSATAQITASMREARDSSWERRKVAYLAHRVENQQRWYGENAAWNEKKGNRWFVGMIVAEAIALLSAIVQIVEPAFPVNLNGALAAAVAACMAWMQAKDFQELAQAYAFAAHDLGLIATQGGHINGDHELARFVVSAEGAISREHTLWVAKRDRLVS